MNWKSILDAKGTILCILATLEQDELQELADPSITT